MVLLVPFPHNEYSGNINKCLNFYRLLSEFELEQGNFWYRENSDYLANKYSKK